MAYSMRMCMRTFDSNALLHNNAQYCSVADEASMQSEETAPFDILALALAPLKLPEGVIGI